MKEMEEVRMFPRKGSQQSTSPGALFCPALRDTARFQGPDQIGL